MELFAGPGRFYRGNLHAQSTRSDGALEPRRLLEMYRRGGSDFVALTDHNVINRENYGMPKDFLVLPGAEFQLLYCDLERISKCYHFVALPRGEGGMAHGAFLENANYSRPSEAQDFVDMLRGMGNEVILCHPEWSHTNWADYGQLRGLLAVEAYNNVCEMEDATGYAQARWDEFLRAGVRICGVASDDCHRAQHVMGGWVQVYAEALTQSAIMDALMAGRFYASNGPEIHRIAVEGRRISVACSPCERVQFVTDRIGNPAVYGEQGVVYEASFTAPPQASYVRVQCMDANRHMAWSQPIYF